MRAHAFKITVNARICFSTRARVCTRGGYIRSGTFEWCKNLPILGHRAGFNPRPCTRVQLPLSPVLLDRTGRLNLSAVAIDAGFIGFPREMNFARSIVPNYAPCLATNYVPLPFISSSFVSFFFLSRGINEYIWRVNCMVKKILLLTRIIYILPLSFSSSIVKWNYHTRGAKFQLNKFPIYSIGLPSFF